MEKLIYEIAVIDDELEILRMIQKYLEKGKNIELQLFQIHLQLLAL